MCIIDGQFWIIETKDGLKLWNKNCNCPIMDCVVLHGSFFRAGVEYVKVTRPHFKSKKPKPIQPLDAGLTPPAMESDMFIKELHAEEQVRQTLVELPPQEELAILKQLQELTGGNIVVAAAILLGFMFMKMQKQKSQETGCGHSQEKCDKAHVELSDAIKKLELDFKDIKQVQLNLFDSLEFAEKVQNLEKDVQQLKEKIK